MFVSTCSLSSGDYRFHFCKLKALSRERKAFLEVSVLCYPASTMDQQREDAHSMDIDYSTPLGSPSYSPPKLTNLTGEMEEIRANYDEAEGEKNKKTIAHCKSEKQARTISSKDADDDDESDEETRTVRRKVKGKYRASSHSAERDINIKNNEKALLNCHLPAFKNLNLPESHPPGPAPPGPRTKDVAPIAMNTDRAGCGRRVHFADAINDALSSSPASPFVPSVTFAPSANDDENAENNPPTNTSDTVTATTTDHSVAARRTPLSERRAVTSLFNRLEELRKQQQRIHQRHQRRQQRGGGRGFRKEKGWGLEWQETMIQEKVDCQGWEDDDDPVFSPHTSPGRERLDGWGEEKPEWEAYDPAAWEQAAEKAEKQKDERLKEERKVRFKVPPSSPMEMGEKGAEGAEGEEESTSISKSRQGNALDGSCDNNIVPRDQELQRSNGTANGHRHPRRELVRAVRSYQAILRGTFLSYEKDEILEVIHRDSDGSFT